MDLTYLEMDDGGDVDPSVLILGIRRDDASENIGLESFKKVQGTHNHLSGIFFGLLDMIQSFVS